MQEKGRGNEERKMGGRRWQKKGEGKMEEREREEGRENRAPRFQEVLISFYTASGQGVLEVY